MRSFEIASRCRLPALLAASLAVFCASPLGAGAQSFDCAKAQSPVEQAICGASDLRTADETLSAAYARAIATVEPETIVRLRAGQRAWIVARNGCASQTPASLNECLARAYRTRTAAIADIVASASAALPPGPPAGVASLAQSSVPAAGEQSTLVTVRAPGRFAVRAQSKTGVALQLVDMIAGPGEIAGDAGTRDGRLDVLLDAGVYKLRTMGAPVAAGDATLSVTPFAVLGVADVSLVRGGETTTTLADLQQRSFWVLVGAGKGLNVDATGRSLRDLRAWRNGTDLSELAAESTSVEPRPGHALTRMRLDGPTEPGLYLVTAYGGEPLAWSDADSAQPLHVRVGPPTFLPGGSSDATIGPSGILSYTLPSSATAARIELAQVSPARLTVRRGKEALGTATVQKASREPIATVVFSAGDGTVAEISGSQGQRVRLRALASASTLRSEGVGPHVVSVDVAGDGGDEVPATALLARFDRGGSKGQVIAANAIRVTPGQAWRRAFNLRGPTTLLVEIASSGPVAARTSGVGARISLEPLLGATAPRADGKRPRQWDVEAGFYTLKIDPVAGAVGVLDLTFGQPDLAVEATPVTPHRDTLDFGIVTFDRQASYQLFVNVGPRVLTAPRMRPLPANLADGALVIGQTARPIGGPAPSPAITPVTPAPPPASAPTKPQRADAPGATPVVPKPVTANIAPLPPKRQSPDAAKALSGNTVANPVAANPVAANPVAASPVAPTPAPRPPSRSQQLPASAMPGDQPLVIPVRTPLGGTITVTDGAAKSVAFTRSPDAIDKNIRATTITIQPTDVQRMLVLAWANVGPAEPIPTLPRDGDEARLAANTPVFFDLARDDRKSFALDIPDGGLYRIETLGRLKTSAAIGTRFLPNIDDAEDNGPGHNAMMQTFLRVGAYRVRVAAQDSSGHLGLVARPAKLIEAATIIAGESARATLADGAGASFAIDIAETGEYRLDLYGLDRTWTARLEDAEGWPLAAPGEVSTLRRKFERGRYRLVVMPADVDAQVVARLRRVEDVKPPEGHGPHPLPFDATVSAQWREPAGQGVARTPDRWEFELGGAAKVTLAASEGMTGDLVHAEDAVPVARIAKGRDFKGELAAGRYAVLMRALGRDDRLDYTLDLRSEELQPGRPRLVELPASIPFAIAQDRVVGLVTFGDTQLSGVLRNENGEAIERMSGRTDDWNLALSRRLPAGRYTLVLAALETPKAAAESGESSDNADETPAKATADVSDGDRDDTQAAVGNANNDDRAKIEVRLSLPAASLARDLALSEPIQVTGTDISRFTLAALSASNNLLLLAAESEAEIVLSLERRDAGGRTNVVGFSRGRAPIIAVPIDADTREGWQLAVWPVDGGPSTTSVVARGIDMAARNAAPVALESVESGGPLARWHVGSIVAPARALLTLPTRTNGLLAGSRAGQPLAALETGPLAPQSETVWFVAPAGSAASIDVQPATAQSDLALTLNGEDVATLPVGEAADQLRVWRADATDGQPGFLSDRGSAVAMGSALALAGDTPVRLWNAGSAGALQLRAKAIDLVRAPAKDAGPATAILVPALTALPLRLSGETKRIALQLAPGVSAFLSNGDTTQGIWAGDIASTRELTGAWTEVLLVNTTNAAAPAGIETVAAATVPPLAAGQAIKRFFGASGSVSFPIEAKDGDRLASAGGTATFVGHDGRVARGASLVLTGPGTLTLDHPAGLLVASVERGDVTPWQAPKPIATNLPKTLALEGLAMALAIRTETPSLLRIRTSAPAILAVRQHGAGDPEPMPLGADITRYVAAGDVELRVFSAHDGPLSGTLDVSAQPVLPIGDGIGDAQVVAPGGSAAFSFEVERGGLVGVGVRADPDRASVRLLSASGAFLGEGVAQMRKLEKGRYVLDARAPPDGPAITIRTAVVGLKPRPGGPPPEEAAKYLELVGMTGKAR